MATSTTAATATTNTSATTATDSATKSNLSRKKLAENMDTFLVMLTTQLKHQDPLSPMDSTEFTNQLVQFANVEQQINANANLETMIGLQRSNQVASSLNYLGWTIEANDTQLPLQNGAAKFSYTLEGERAELCTIAITDEDGKLVYSMPGKLDPGTYDVEWDGKDFDGKQLEDGLYKISITAIGSEDAEKETRTSTKVQAVVTGVSTEGDQVILDASGARFNIDKVLNVRSS